MVLARDQAGIEPRTTGIEMRALGRHRGEQRVQIAGKHWQGAMLRAQKAFGQRVVEHGDEVLPVASDVQQPARLRGWGPTS